MSDVWGLAAGLSGIGAATLVASRTKNWSGWARTSLSLFAAVVVAGLVGGIRPVAEDFLFRNNDDYAWRAVRQAILKPYPELGPILALDSGRVEQDIRTAVLPLIRDQNLNNPSVLGAVATATQQVFRRRIFPLAIYGAPDALNEWGATTVPLLNAIAEISPEACRNYIVTGINRYSPNPKIDPLLRHAQSALLRAYQTSDSTRFRLSSDQDTVGLFKKALTQSDPTFSREDFDILQDAANAKPSEACTVFQRFYRDIASLPSAERAQAYRHLMKAQFEP